ncbi:MAG: disulfide bond formation protein B [Gammaproteobacteria bacterium]|nr:disulfide bond formation protein B [Gammaproteobacteria bacterium]
MSIPDKRLLNLSGFLVCAGLMGFALYAQHQLLLEPCPLCVLQRVAVIALGVVFLGATLHNAAGAGRFTYVGLLALASLFGAIVAGRHVWLQNLPKDQVPACGPGLDYMLENFPFQQVVDMIFTGSGECAEIVWQFLGLSMPGWVLVFVIGLGAAGIWNNLRKQ